MSSAQESLLLVLVSVSLAFCAAVLLLRFSRKPIDTLDTNTFTGDPYKCIQYTLLLRTYSKEAENYLVYNLPLPHNLSHLNFHSSIKLYSKNLIEVKIQPMCYTVSVVSNTAVLCISLDNFRNKCIDFDDSVCVTLNFFSESENSNENLRCK